MVAGRVWNIAYVSRHIACACGNEVSASPLFSGPRGVAAVVRVCGLGPRSTDGSHLVRVRQQVKIEVNRGRTGLKVTMKLHNRQHIMYSANLKRARECGGFALYGSSLKSEDLSVLQRRQWPVARMGKPHFAEKTGLGRMLSRVRARRFSAAQSRGAD